VEHARFSLVPMIYKFWRGSILLHGFLSLVERALCSSGLYVFLLIASGCSLWLEFTSVGMSKIAMDGH